MQYEIYEAKVKKVSAFLVKLYSHIALIVTILALLVAAATAAVAAKGSIVSESEFKAEIEYGSKLEYAAEAIFGDASYEYRAKGTEEWSDVAPTYPGEYEIRAYAITSFGTRRYGDVHTFTITPRELTLRVSEESIQYGDLPSVSGNTINGDTVSACSVIFDKLEADATAVTARADKATLVILDKDGKDVTSCYVVADTPDASVPLTPRPLQVTVETLTAQYNGQPFTFTGYELTGGELVEGDTKQAVFETKNESGDIINQLINVGTISSNGPKLEFKDKNGVDVTHLYAVEIISGTLTVEQRPLLIQTKNGELTYSGTEQSYPEFEQMDEYLLDGHEIRVIEEKTSRYLDCGEYENTLSFVILDRDGNDVSANYSINVGYGQVTVKPRKVTVTTRGTGDSPFEYNGKDHTLPEFNVDNATEADESATTDFSVRDVGTYENRFEVAFFRDTENVSYNYEIEYVYGVLEVVPREITLKLEDDRKVYDGTPLTSVKYGVAAGSFGLVEGHNLTLETNGSITRPDEGTVVNEYVADSAKVTDANGADVTANYVITVEAGSLSIDKRPMKVVPISVSRVYDGTRLTGGYEIDEGSAVDGHEIHVELSGASWRIGCGMADPYYINKVTVLDAEGADVTAYYDVDHSGEGILKITPRPLYLKTESASKVYDGTALTAPAGFIVLDRGPDTGLADNETLFSKEAEIGTLPAITNVWEGINWQSGFDGTIQNVQTAIVMNNGVPVTGNYDIHYCKDENDRDEDNRPVYGTLTIIRRRITLETPSAEKIYDGDALSAPCDLLPLANEGDGKLADDQSLVIISALPKYTNVFDTVGGRRNGEEGNNVQHVAVYNGTDDVSENYKITYRYGTLTVSTRPIKLRTESLERVYDGTPLHALSSESAWGGQLFETVLGETGLYDLVEGHEAVNHPNTAGSKMPSITDANANIGEDPLTPFKNALKARIVDAYGQDMSENYEIVGYEYGTLTVRRRPITLVSVSGEWIYDGQEHSFEDSSEYLNNYVNGQRTPFRVVEGTIVPGQILGYIDSEIPTIEIPTITDAGWVKNRMTPIITADVNGNPMGVTQNYTIEWEYGTLTVKPRHIKVELPDATWVYDGMMHVVGTEPDESLEYNGVGLTKDSNRLVDGHKLSVPGLSIMNAGTDTNEQVVTILDSYDHPVKEGNYTIEYADYGTITVERRPLVIQLYGEKIYDGQFVTEFDWYAPQLCTGAGHTMTVSALEKDIINADTYSVNPDLYTLVILDVSGADVTGNYDPSGMPGEYVIDPRPITVRTDDGSKLYDGTPLVVPGFSVVTNFGGMALVPGQRIELNVTAAPVTPGYYYNTADSLRIYDADGVDVTGNYCAASEETEMVIFGKLAISVDVTIRVTTESDQKFFDGDWLECKSGEWKILSGELPDYFKVTMTVTGRQLYPGSSMNTFEIQVEDTRWPEGHNYRLVKALVLDDPENDIESVLGTLTVLEPTDDREILVLTPVYISKTFDGQPLDYSNLEWYEKVVMTEQLQKLKDENYTLEFDVMIYPGEEDEWINGQWSVSAVGDYKTAVARNTFRVYDPHGVDVTDRYLPDTQGKPGTMQVFAHEPIKIYLYSLDVIYDGKYPEWTMYDYVIEYDGMEIEGQLAEDGSYVYYEFIDTDGNQVRLEIICVRGPEKASGSWTVADLNESFHDRDPYNDCVSYKATVNGHHADFDSMPLELVMFEEDPSAYPLTVEKISIEFTAASEKREYDPDNREPLTNDGYHITKGALAEGHRVQSVSVQSDAYLVEIGQCNNKITHVVIVDEDGWPVTEHYNITYVDGLLELI